MNAYIRVLRIGLVGLALLGSVSGQRVAQRRVSRQRRRCVRWGACSSVFRTTASSTTSSSESIAAPSTSPATASKGGSKRMRKWPRNGRAASMKWPTRSRCCPRRRTTTESAGRPSTGSTRMTSCHGTPLAASSGCCGSLRDERQFPGMQPVGVYPIHIIVKNGRTMLLGVVDSAADRQIAEVRAREVTGVFEVENGLTVVRAAKEAGSR